MTFLAILLAVLGVVMIMGIPFVFAIAMMPAIVKQSCLALIVGILGFGAYLAAIAICFAQAVRLCL